MPNASREQNRERGKQHNFAGEGFPSSLDFPVPVYGVLQPEVFCLVDVHGL